MFFAVLRYLYGVPTSPEDEHADIIAPMNWRELCGVVDKFGIPSLRKSAIAKLEVHLKDLLEQGLSGDQNAIDDFVWEVQNIYRPGNIKDSGAIELTAKLTCKHFTDLRKHEGFNDLTDEYPEFLRAVLDHAAHEGLLGQR